MRYALPILVFLLSPVASASDLTEEARQTYGFESWPGKSGPLKQGLALHEVDLEPWQVHSRRNRLTTSGEIIVRYGAPNSKPAFEIGVRVFDSVPDAQEHLLAFLGGSTMVVPRGDSLGLSIGDISFATKEGGGFDSIAFVRNNVTVRLSRIYLASGGPVADPDIRQIAERIDARIIKEKVAKKAKHLGKPRIKKFTSASTTKPDEPVEIALKITDPKGGHIEIHFDEGGGMVYEKDGTWYFQAEKPLEYTITVYAINERFLVSQRSLTIRVAN